MAIELLHPEWGAQRPIPSVTKTNVIASQRPHRRGDRRECPWCDPPQVSTNTREIATPVCGLVRDDRVIRGVLFDMDGLVLDSEALYTRFWREAARFYGYPMTCEQSLGMRSLGKKLGQPYLESLFGPGIDYTTLRTKRIELMDAYVAQHGIAPKPGIYQLLDALDQAHIPAAITSSSPMDSIRRHLEKADLLHRFQALCSGHDIPNGKPAPDIYLLGAKKLGLDPKNCLALEDSPTGILSAYRAGCLPVMVPDLDQPSDETKALLYAKADSLTDVIRLVNTRHAEEM